jgi:dihydrofolate reductase
LPLWQIRAILFQLVHEREMHTRPKISINISASIDGFIARKDHSLDWLDCVEAGSEDYGFNHFLNSIDGVILGRKTYHVAATAYRTPKWPYSGKRLIVLSNSLNQIIPEAQLYSGDLVNLVLQLHDEGIQHIWIDGGTIISQFLRLNLVDEMTLSIIPILLGEGIPLFEVKKELPCRLISAQSYRSGLVQGHYELIKE